MLSYNPPRYLFRRYEILRNVQPGEKFLEVGAGNIKLAQSLLSYFESGTIVDFSRYVRAVYQRLPNEHKQRLTLMVGDIEELAFTETYACVVTCEVMEHVADDEGFLRRLYSLLDEGGQLLLSVPSRMKYWSIHDEIVGHLRRYEKKQIIELVERSGFTDIKVLSYGFPFVNLLRLPRILLAQKQQKVKKDQDKRRQTEDSGVHHAGEAVNWLGLLVNQYTWLPFAWIAALFNARDWSDGYIVVARK